MHCLSAGEDIELLCTDVYIFPKVLFLDEIDLSYSTINRDWLGHESAKLKFELRVQDITLGSFNPQGKQMHC